MNFPDITRDLACAMPDLRGKLRAHVPLAPFTWFKTGGAAQAMFWPEDNEDLAYVLARLDPAIPVMPLGLGSNLLVRDGGIEGLVILVGPGFGAVTIEHDVVSVGAAVPDVKLASAAAIAGLAGFSFLRGIPGTIGGALRMNAGAFGGEIKDVFLSCEGVDRSGEIRRFDAASMHFSYRHCGVDGVIFTRARLIGKPGDQETIRAEMAEIAQARSATQPVNTRTGGSTFKNPHGRKAWQLIDAAGCRGLVLGDAQVSELHCNFLINRGQASAADIEDLGEEVRRRVFETSGVMLEWEIQRVGVR
ncbi:MAG: UDP-N-acetylmuramate dehydrogenase [Beijerinckiaceae bacterium]